MRDEAAIRLRSLDDIYADYEAMLLFHDGERELLATDQQGEILLKEMKSESEAIEKNKTWKLVNLPPGNHKYKMGLQSKMKSRREFGETQGETCGKRVCAKTWCRLR